MKFSDFFSTDASQVAHLLDDASNKYSCNAITLDEYHKCCTDIEINYMTVINDCTDMERKQALISLFNTLKEVACNM